MQPSFAAQLTFQGSLGVWHADKNQGNLEESSTRFKEIQNAYEILSDPREKAWCSFLADAAQNVKLRDTESH